METNIRFVHTGNDLYFIGRKVSISKTDLLPDQLHTICTILKNRKIAATPFLDNGKYFLLTEYRDRLNDITIELENSESKGTQFTITLHPESDTVKLYLTDLKQRKIIEELYQKRAQINILQN